MCSLEVSRSVVAPRTLQGIPLPIGRPLGGVAMFASSAERRCAVARAAVLLADRALAPQRGTEVGEVSDAADAATPPHSTRKLNAPSGRQVREQTDRRSGRRRLEPSGRAAGAEQAERPLLVPLRAPPGRPGREPRRALPRRTLPHRAALPLSSSCSRAAGGPRRSWTGGKPLPPPWPPSPCGSALSISTRARSASAPSFAVLPPSSRSSRSSRCLRRTPRPRLRPSRSLLRLARFIFCLHRGLTGQGG